MPANPCRLAALAAVLCTVVVAAFPTSANAGTYTMRSCNVPGQPPAPAGPWTWHTSPTTHSFNACADGGGFGVWVSGERRMSPFDAGVVQIRRPDTGPKQTIRIQQVKLWMISRLAGTGSPAFTPFRAFTTSGSYQQDETFGPPGADQRSIPYVSPNFGSGDTVAFQAMLFCSSGGPGDCYLQQSRGLEIQGSEVTLFEGVAPAVDIAGGTLMTGHEQYGARSLSYLASDGESGVERVEVLLGDRLVGVSDFRRDAGRCPHSNWNACQETVSQDIVVDTNAVPDGDHPLTVRVTDAAANRTVSQGGIVRVRNHGRPTGAPAGGTAPTRAPAAAGVSFTNSDSSVMRTSRRVKYGKPLNLRGILRDGNGRIMPNARVDVLVRPAVGETQFRLVRQVTTDSDGVLRYTVPRGPSRVIRLAYRGGAANASYTAIHDIRVAVTAAATLKLSRTRLHNGERLGFSGLLRGVKTRKVTEVQVLERGRWKTIASVRTRSSGRFSWSYRFRRTFSPTTYTFRVRVRTERGFPYATGYSPRRSVRVR